MHLYKYFVLRHSDLLAPPWDVHMGVVWVQLARTHSALKHCKFKTLKAIFHNFQQEVICKPCGAPARRPSHSHRHPCQPSPPGAKHKVSTFHSHFQGININISININIKCLHFTHISRAFSIADSEEIQSHPWLLVGQTLRQWFRDFKGFSMEIHSEYSQ